MSILNLEHTSPEESSPSSSSGEDPRDVETVESVRKLLESRQPPGLARIRRFVLKPRPRLWKFGVGVWLWLVQIAEWSVLLLRWLGRGSGRVIKALGLAGFLGRRVQNLGARVGSWGRNWSGAEGRLGRLGVRCATFGERAVKGGAALAAVTGGAGDVTERAARFLRDVLDEPAADPVTGGGSTPGPTPSRSPRQEPPPAPATDAVRRERPPASEPPSESKPPPAPAPRRAGTGAPEPPPKPAPAPAPATPPPLPDDVPWYLQAELNAIRQTSRPLPEAVRRLILQVTEARGWTRPAELAGWLGFGTNYLNRTYLAPMTKAGLVERQFPDRLSHPRQAYRAVRAAEPDATPDP